MSGYKFYCKTEEEFLKIENQLFKKGYSWEFFKGSAIIQLKNRYPSWFYTDEKYKYIWRCSYEKIDLKLLKIKHVWI